jgi:peptide/nickel transport system substrate-binding protein
MNYSHFGAVDADGDRKIDSIDDLIIRARHELDPERRIELWKEAQLKILRYMAAYPVMSLGYTIARRATFDWGYRPAMITDGPKATENTRMLRKE